MKVGDCVLSCIGTGFVDAVYGEYVFVVLDDGERFVFNEEELTVIS